ncbi:hypothetical protein BaRGS_00004252, partial [Batillaria attramentaria]
AATETLTQSKSLATASLVDIPLFDSLGSLHASKMDALTMVLHDGPEHASKMVRGQSKLWAVLENQSLPILSQKPLDYLALDQAGVFC